MSKEKQIDKLCNDLNKIFDEKYRERRIITAYHTAKRLYEQGYRKQSEGENVSTYPSSAFECSECHWQDWDLYTADSRYNFCPHCGAKMKGGAE